MAHVPLEVLQLLLLQTNILGIMEMNVFGKFGTILSCNRLINFTNIFLLTIDHS